MSEPIVFAAPADIELAPDPIRPNWIIEGKPEARSRRLAESADGTSSVMAWSCTAGRFTWCYAVDETVHIISGEVFVTDGSGATRRLGPGDMAFFPAGSRSTWTIPNEVRKLAVCRHSMPRLFGHVLLAWNKAFDILTGFSAGERQAGKRPAAQTGARVASA
jgi:uncharacterized protein